LFAFFVNVIILLLNYVNRGGRVLIYSNDLMDLFHDYKHGGSTLTIENKERHPENAKKVSRLFNQWVKDNESLLQTATFYGKQSAEIYAFKTLFACSSLKPHIKKDDVQKCLSIRKIFLEKAKEAPDHFKQPSALFNPEKLRSNTLEEKMTISKKAWRVFKRAIANFVPSFLFFTKSLFSNSK